MEHFPEGHEPIDLFDNAPAAAIRYRVRLRRRVVSSPDRSRSQFVSIIEGLQ